MLRKYRHAHQNKRRALYEKEGIEREVFGAHVDTCIAPSLTRFLCCVFAKVQSLTKKGGPQVVVAVVAAATLVAPFGLHVSPGTCRVYGAWGWKTFCEGGPFGREDVIAALCEWPCNGALADGRFGATCFRRIPDEPQAREAAVCPHGSLATIHSAEEQAVAAAVCGLPGACWIGLEADKGADFAWSTGEAVTFTDWYPSEPVLDCASGRLRVQMQGTEEICGCAVYPELFEAALGSTLASVFAFSGAQLVLSTGLYFAPRPPSSSWTLTNRYLRMAAWNNIFFHTGMWNQYCLQSAPDGIGLLLTVFAGIPMSLWAILILHRLLAMKIESMGQGTWARRLVQAEYRIVAFGAIALGAFFGGFLGIIPRVDFFLGMAAVCVPVLMLLAMVPAASIHPQSGACGCSVNATRR